MLIAPIKINGRGNQNFIEVEANIVKSTYGRTNFKKFINENLTQDDILAVQNKKSTTLILGIKSLTPKRNNTNQCQSQWIFILLVYDVFLQKARVLFKKIKGVTIWQTCQCRKSTQ